MAITERYVRADAAGGLDGTADSATDLGGGVGSFTFSEMITDINTPRVGYRYNVKAGTYSRSASDTITGDGSTTSPNVIRGYNSTIGDLDDQGRSTGGALNATNFPVIAYGSTFQLAASGADYLILQNLKFTGNKTSYIVFMSSTGVLIRCYVENSSTNANGHTCAVGFYTLDCDLLQSGTGGGAALVPSGATFTARGCRIKSTSAEGVLTSANTTLINCTIYECGADGVRTTSTTRTFEAQNCTIVNCTGDGIEFVTGTTGQVTISGNHITGCADGVKFNTSTCIKLMAMNRFRNNTNNVTGGGDWEGATSVGRVTTAASDSDDFTDATTDDYSLKAGAAAISKGPGYLIDIGANGTPVVTPSSGGPPPRILTPLNGGAFPIF